MDRSSARDLSTPEWLRPRTESQGLVRYVSTIRERKWLILAITAISVLAAGVYVAVAPKTYEAEADLLITPVSSSDPNTAGLGLITQSNDPTQDISTGARLVATPAVARRVKQALRLSASPEQILEKVTIEPVAQSTLVAVRASERSARDAARLANTYARAAVDQRTDDLHQTIDQQLPGLRARAAAGSSSLTPRIASLTSLSVAPDPTVRVATTATVPTSQASPKPKLALAAGLIGGLILGLGAAFASQALDPRLRREEQIRDLFRLPVLARVPRLPGRRGDGTAPRLSSAATEAYRTLRATLTAQRQGDLHSVLITSSMAGEGKTTTAMNFARVLAQGGSRVILIEGDLRRPSIVETLSVRPLVGMGAVLIGSARLEDALFTTDEYGKNLQFLVAEHAAEGLSDRLALPSARHLIEEAEALAEYVVVDSPPLTEVVDALPLAQHVDAVVILARVGSTRLHRLRELGDMLAQGGVVPAGLVMTDTAQVPDSPYYLDGDPARVHVA